MRAWHVERRTARSLAIPAFLVVAGILGAFRFLNVYPWNSRVFDLHTYWATRFGLDYASQPGPAGAYLYSPAFAQLIAPLAALPLPVFATIWTLVTAGLLYWLTGRWAIVVALIPAVALTIAQGQLDLAFAVVIVLGFRWPALWAFPILTKVTPGVGIVWFLVRREWRSLMVAVASTIAIVAVSAFLDPHAWRGWIEMLGRSDHPPVGTNLVYLPIALGYRLPLALAIVAWGAATSRRWTIPIAVTLAMPILWLNSPTILVAIFPMIALGATAPAAAWLRSHPLGAPETDAATDAIDEKPALDRVGARVTFPSA